MDFVVYWSKRLELPTVSFIVWLSISRSKFYQWLSRYIQENFHKGKIPRDFWLQNWEKIADGKRVVNDSIANQVRDPGVEEARVPLVEPMTGLLERTTEDISGRAKPWIAIWEWTQGNSIEIIVNSLYCERC